MFLGNMKLQNNYDMYTVSPTEIEIVVFKLFLFSKFLLLLPSVGVVGGTRQSTDYGR